MENNDYERIKNQIIDIYIYDTINSYEILRHQGLKKENINSILDTYQKINIKRFTNEINKIKQMYK